MVYRPGPELKTIQLQFLYLTFSEPETVLVISVIITGLSTLVALKVGSAENYLNDSIPLLLLTSYCFIVKRTARFGLDEKGRIFAVGMWQLSMLIIGTGIAFQYAPSLFAAHGEKPDALLRSAIKAQSGSDRPYVLASDINPRTVALYTDNFLVPQPDVAFNLPFDIKGQIERELGQQTILVVSSAPAEMHSTAGGISLESIGEPRRTCDLREVICFYVTPSRLVIKDK